MFFIVPIEFGTPEFDEALALRDRILRKPLGLEFTPEQIAAEFDATHLGAYAGSGVLLGYLQLVFLENGAVKMRQVAVDGAQQRIGIGAALVAFSETVARAGGGRRMVLHARETAVPFYLKLGYAREGDRFEEVGIPHFAMFKNLEIRP